MRKSMTLKELKDNMWVEVCEGDMKPKTKKYLNIIQDVGDEEVCGWKYIDRFYKILTRLIEEDLIEFRGGDYDWIYNELAMYGEEDNFDEYMREWRQLVT